MKKTLLTILLANAFAFPALASEANLVFGGYSLGKDVSYGYLGAVRAINNDINKDGSLIRIGGGYGKYKYSAPSVSNSDVQGHVSSSDLMYGYQKFFDKGRITVFGGANYDDYNINKADNSNNVAGGKFGAKGQIEITLNPVKNIVLSNISSYTSAYNSYWSQSYIGYDFGKFVFGPEAAFLGNRAFNQQRFGGNISNIDLKFAKLYFAAGYMRSFGNFGDDGAYTTVGLSSQF